MPRRSKLFSVRKPRLTTGKKGVRITAPSLRIGRKAGLNISRRGVSASLRTRAGTLNSRSGCSRSLPVLILAFLLPLAFTLLANAASLQDHSTFLPQVIKEIPFVTFPTSTPTGTIQPTATLTPTITTTPTPTQTQPPTSATVRITFIENDPPGDDLIGEYVQLQNQGGQPADLTGWTLRDNAEHVYTFPSFTLNPGAYVQIWTRAGSNTSTDLYWGSDQPIWNNDGGDCAYLRDTSSTLIHQYCY